MSSDDEVDYMSDAFLESICGKQDIRPGLIKSHALQYDHNQAVKKLKTDEKNRVFNPSFKQREVESREDGLKKPLDSDNVGFKMLQKLGFKPGSGLGKSGEGRVEPVGVEIKADRQGFGRKSSLEEIAKLRQKFRAEAKEKMLNVNDYRSRKAEEAAERRASIDLLKSQRVCWELDIKECIEEPAELWFWPESKQPQNDEDTPEEENSCTSNDDQSCDPDASADTNTEEAEDSEFIDEDEFTVQERLQMLTLYLRNTHLYCVWCGHTFVDKDDLRNGCPGPTREDH